MLKRINLSLLLLYAGGCLAQTASSVIDKMTAVSPTAASFTQYTKIPVGQFTGLPDIKIPIYTINVDDKQIPISLSYFARGVQPNAHSGWVGTNWSLTAGGTITRRINGMPDEFMSDYVTFPSPEGNSKYGWYWGANHQQVYSPSQYLGGLVQTGSGIASNITVDSSPDEFDFSINGISGAFFLSSDGSWKVRSAGGETIKVQETMGSVTIKPLQNPTSAFTKQTINPTFLQFTLTAGDGTKYVFGGGASPAYNTTIEFNRRGPSNELYNNNLIAMTWHIVEIDLPSGKKVLYDYFRNGSVFTYSPVSSVTYLNNFNSSSGPVTGNTYDDVDYSCNVMDPVYLKSITFPEGKIQFSASMSGESDLLEARNINSMQGASNSSNYPFPGAVGAYSIYHTYTDLGNNYTYNAQGNVTGIWYKLDNIEIDNYLGNKVKDIQFAYSQDAATRLFLASVQEVDGSGQPYPPYTFVYNSLALPKYCTVNVDHWGFYNGRKAIPSITLDANRFVTTGFQDQYYAFREPDLTYAQAGILTQVNYPTGGYSQYFYESNQYSKWVSSQQAINPLPQNAVGGGLRIAKIAVVPASGAPGITYEYSYVSNIGSSVSSGVLGSPKPNYAQNDQVNYVSYDANGNPVSLGAGISFGFWGTNTIYPSQNDDGNVVTYTKVIERQSSAGIFNGKTESLFSNHDNGYSNNRADAVAYSLYSDIQLFHYSDRGFERGMLLSESIYDKNDNLIKKTENTYNDDIARFNLCVKGVYSSVRSEMINVGASVNPFLNFVNNSAIRYYTFFPYLKQTIETVYVPGTANSTVTKTQHTYDPTFDGYNGTKNQIQSTLINSRGQVLSTKYKFPQDYNLASISNPTDPFTVGVRNLQNKNALSFPLEITHQLTESDGSNLRTTGSQLNVFDGTFPIPVLTYVAGIAAPSLPFSSSSVDVSGNLVKDSRYEPRYSIDNLDNTANVLQQHLPLGANISYQWGYNGSYLTAIVKNATNTYKASANTGYKDFFYANFEEGDGTSSVDDAKTGHYSFGGPTYSNTISHIENGNYRLTYWKKSGTGWTFQSQSITVTGNAYPISISGQIDDVKLYPANALMVTYTYDPIFGMTSYTDGKDQVTYYGHDALGRLINIKNEQSEIVKSIRYHYANQTYNPRVPTPEQPIGVDNITGTAVSLKWLAVSNLPSNSCYLQYIDLNTSTTYQYSITCGPSGTALVLVPAMGHNYQFSVIQNLVSGTQVSSASVNIFVPSY